MTDEHDLTEGRDENTRFSRILESQGKSRNLRKEFSRPGKLLKSHGIPMIPLIGH